MNIEDPLVEKVARAIYAADITNVWPWDHSVNFARRKQTLIIAQAAIEAMNVQSVESALVNAIDQWMRKPTEDQQWANGNAQGIARSLAILRGTTFTEEWTAGLDSYQNSITGVDQ